MSELTLMADIADQVKKYWSPVAINSLKQDSLLPSLVSRDYEGNLEKEGDVVYISEIDDITASRKTTGSGEDAFETAKLKTSRVTITANQTITAAIEVSSLSEIQSQIKSESAPLREAMIRALEVKLNEYLYGLVSPSSSSPDHIISGVTDFNATQIAAVRQLAAKARWMKDGNWFALLSPTYFSDFLSATTLTSSDYVDDKATIGGQFVQRRFGFNILEDNSDAIATLGTSGDDCALIFHKSFMNLVMPQMVQFKLSDMHVVKRHTYLLSAHIVCGAGLGVNGSKKHIKVYNT